MYSTEHIVASNISKHFANLNIFYDLQHGFPEKWSCETQLIMLIDELFKYLHSRKQTDLILLDLSKIFFKVAHEKLLQNFTSMVSEETLYFGYKRFE